MFEAKGLLEAYLNGVLGLSGAASASVFIPTPWSRVSPAILIQAGGGPPLAELSDLATAAAFCSQAVSEGPRAESTLRPGAAVLKSATPGGVLLPIPLITQLWQRVMAGPLSDRDVGYPARRATDRESGVAAAGWLGLRFPDDEGGISSASAQGGRADADEFWMHLLALAGSLASYYVHLYGVLTDPLTGLPGRPEFLSLLREEINRSRGKGQPYSLLLVNPDRFECVNDSCGREAADTAIREIVAKLQTACRRTDLLARHGAAVFAVGLAASAADTALAVGEKIRRHLSEHRYLNEELQLEFSVGAATVEVGESDVDELELIRRADIGLGTAKLEGGCRTAMWRTESDRLLLAPRDRLSGIFTGNAETDYRNMGLLWDALTAIASNTDASRLAALVVDRLTLLRAARIALFECDAGTDVRLLCARSGPSGQAGTRGPVSQSDLLPAEIALARQVASTGEAAQRAVAATPEADGTPRLLAAYAIPLRVGSRVVGVLLIVGAENQLRLSPSDLPFLSGFAAQLALALDHARLAEQQRAREEHERRLLRSELQDLRAALQQAKLVYRSDQFEALLGTVRRVAPTDTTILIAGESGTGKELVAHTIHQLSTRRGKPFAIVDCGAIPATLIESELFGHERGAFTGAQERRVGRLAQAAGGTVLLDEIGELPLEVQAKLLRFVQEKQFTSVGASTLHRVDVRILAATNRNLDVEVKAGRFREDLFHRLNVVRIDVPPLRSRPDDILHLARHFLEIFAVQYQKPVHGFSAEAEQMLVRHSWPGNVRELQNRILQAVILADGEVLTPGDLRLERCDRQAGSPDAGGGIDHASVSGPGRVPHDRAASTSDGQQSDPGRQDDTETVEAPWHLLRGALAHEIACALEHGQPHIPPLGRWVAHDIVLEAHQAAGGVIRRTAALLHEPETTVARRLAKAQVDVATSRRSPSWTAVRDAIRVVVRSPDAATPASLLDRAEDLVIAEILAQVPDDPRVGAQLLGTSLPTFRRHAAMVSVLA